MEVFGRLYDMEREIKDKTAEQRKTARQELAKPLWPGFGRWLEENVGMLNEKSAIHKTFAYTMKRYKQRSVYMDLSKPEQIKAAAWLFRFVQIPVRFRAL